MIDVHTHILPGMDDGSSSVRVSLRMLEAEAQAGIERVVFTPHYYSTQESPEQFLRRRKAAWERLLPRMYSGLPKVSFGAEVHYFEGISASDQVGCLRILGTPFLLLEMPFHTWTSRMAEDVLALQDRPDIQVILAHVDRYERFGAGDFLPMLRQAGVLMQVNISRFSGVLQQRQTMARLRKGEFQLLGTDCHNLETRPPNFHLLPEAARQLVEQNEDYRRFVRQIVPHITK